MDLEYVIWYFAGSRDFNNFLGSINTMARLSFGLYEYDDYVSDGLGHGYEGIGLGNYIGFKYLLLWMSFLLLSTIIVNILIAVISDGFEIHKDKQRLRTKSGETFIVYAFRRLVYLTFFQFFPCCKKTKDFGSKKMRFASSKHAKVLLKYTDALPDGMVFDQKLQRKFCEELLGKKIMIVLAKGQCALSGQSLYQSRKLPKQMLLTSDETVSYETTHEFFSNIQSEKSLRLVIDTIFDLADAETEKKAFETKDVYNKIWNLYKHTDEERERKEESRVDGNHVRKVVKPMDEKMEKMKDEMQWKKWTVSLTLDKMEAKMVKNKKNNYISILKFSF